MLTFLCLTFLFPFRSTSSSRSLSSHESSCIAGTFETPRGTWLHPTECITPSLPCLSSRVPFTPLPSCCLWYPGSRAVISHLPSGQPSPRFRFVSFYHFNDEPQSFVYCHLIMLLNRSSLRPSSSCELPAGNRSRAARTFPETLRRCVLEVPTIHSNGTPLVVTMVPIQIGGESSRELDSASEPVVPLKTWHFPSVGIFSYLFPLIAIYPPFLDERRCKYVLSVSAPRISFTSWVHDLRAFFFFRLGVPTA